MKKTEWILKWTNNRREYHIIYDKKIHDGYCLICSRTTQEIPFDFSKINLRSVALGEGIKP